MGLIPCYNAAKYCEKVIEEAVSACHDLILINDGSTDGTQKILKRMASLHPKNIHLIEFELNRGKGFGLIEGFKYAADHLHFDALVTLDADGHVTHDLRGRRPDYNRGAGATTGGQRIVRGVARDRQLRSAVVSCTLAVVDRAQRVVRPEFGDAVLVQLRFAGDLADIHDIHGKAHADGAGGRHNICRIHAKRQVAHHVVGNARATAGPETDDVAGGPVLLIVIVVDRATDERLDVGAPVADEITERAAVLRVVDEDCRILAIRKHH